jgi:hypothetical protein
LSVSLSCLLATLSHFSLYFAKYNQFLATRLWSY